MWDGTVTVFGFCGFLGGMFSCVFLLCGYCFKLSSPCNVGYCSIFVF